MARNWIAEAIGAVVADIRRETAKVGWFGRFHFDHLDSNFGGLRHTFAAKQ